MTNEHRNAVIAELADRIGVHQNGWLPGIGAIVNITFTKDEADALVAYFRSSVVAGDYILPCDVKLDPATTIRKGCALSTLMAAFKVREHGWPEVTPEQIAAVNKLMKPEFDGGDWQEVESDTP